MPSSEIFYMTGDATAPVGEGQKLIVHVCNDIGAWGAGFVLALSKRWK
jgi:O-acetyl-ADP-ribose deacetylase (regulator of RNase III)